MAETKEIHVPDIGDFDEVEVIDVLVSPGDTVAEEDSLVTLESDKAAMDIPSPVAGVIREVKISVGDKVSEGSLVALIEAAEGGAETAAGEKSAAEESRPGPETSKPETSKPETPKPAAPQAEQQPAAPAPKPAVESGPPPTLPTPRRSGQSIPHASPSIRRLARELGVDLAQVIGTGPKGRILKSDVKGFVKGAMAGGGGGGMPFNLPPAPQLDFSKFGEIKVQPLGRIKKISGPHLHRAWVSVPHVTQFDECDITDLESLRQSLKNEAARHGVKISPLPFVMKAVVSAMQEFPEFCASLDETGQNLILKKYYNIGVAVDTPGGLMVPVIRDVDKKGVFQIAGELMAISQKARDGKLGPADMSGGCFTISSLGGIGGTAFTPIINAPEVAILGLSRSKMAPVWNGSEFQPRLMLPLSLSYDHRVIDGALGARFIVRLGQMITALEGMALWQR